MPKASPVGRNGPRLLAIALALVASACATRPSQPSAEPALAGRLVLALDGLDYRDIVAARERGLFASFHPPSRLISTFPSGSDIAWHEVFGVLPPRGYQRVYYSNANNRLEGGALDPLRPIEFEERVDMAFGGKFHHLSAYVISTRIANGELDDIVEKFFTIHGRTTVYAYSLGPDALQHTRGDIDEYLRYLDAKLTVLQARYRAATGRTLEIDVLSDHGNNKAIEAQFIQIEDALNDRGFRLVRRLRTPADVALSVDGVMTGFGLFCDPDSVESLAGALARVEGVELVTSRLSESRFRVRGRDATALVERGMVDGEESYRYVRETGDPLELGAVADSLQRADGAPDAGYATAAAWLAATAGHKYPAAPVRIARGHTTVTLNPAPILVSVDDAHRVSLGLTTVANLLRRLGGSHGALAASNSVGIVMSNARATHDDLTATVRRQFGGFADFHDPAREKPGARLGSMAMLIRDPLSPFDLDSTSTASSAVGLEVWLGRDETIDDESLVLLAELRRFDSARGSEIVVAKSRTASGDWRRAPFGRRYFIELSRLGFTGLLPDEEYALRVSAAPARDPGREREVASFLVRADAKGALAAY